MRGRLRHAQQCSLNRMETKSYSVIAAKDNVFVCSPNDNMARQVVADTNAATVSISRHCSIYSDECRHGIDWTRNISHIAAFI